MYSTVKQHPILTLLSLALLTLDSFTVFPEHEVIQGATSSLPARSPDARRDEGGPRYRDVLLDLRHCISQQLYELARQLFKSVSFIAINGTIISSLLSPP